jgi:very-short-patch-repair endonuclease
MPSKRLIDFARNLRTESTDAERRLWQLLRAHRFQDFKFRRQQPIGPYIVDFICLEEKLIVELDGGQHAEAVEYDVQRDGWLRNEGYRVLRVWNNELLENESGVMEKILEMLTLSPGPSPLKGEGRKP